MKHERVHSKLDELHVCTRFARSLRTSCTRKPECTRVATFTQLASGNWRVQVRRKTRYVAETFRRRKDGEEWALEMVQQHRPERLAHSIIEVVLFNARCPSGRAPPSLRRDDGAGEIFLWGGDRFCPRTAIAAATSSRQSPYSEHRR